MENEFSDVAGRIVVGGDRYYVRKRTELFGDGGCYTLQQQRRRGDDRKPDPNHVEPFPFFQMDDRISITPMRASRSADERRNDWS
ncbi:MAG: hypothetical protein ACLUEV_11860 [Alistipes sp.]